MKTLIHWIAICLVDSVIQPSNNRGMVHCYLFEYTLEDTLKSYSGGTRKWSEIWSDIKRELLGLKWAGNTTRQLTPPKESPRLVGDFLVSIY